MKRLKLCLLFLTGIMMLPAVAANLLKNSDFSDLTGAKLPRGWEFRGKALPEVTDKGCLTLGGNASGMMAIQYNLPVKPGTKYTMRWFAAGKAPYKCYIEYTYSDNGKKKIGGQHYNLIEPVEQGSTVSFQFSVPSKATQTYVVFSVKSAEKVTVSKLILQESAEAERAEGMLKNSDFSILDRKQLPVGWDCRGKAENYRFANGKAEVKGHKNFLTASLKNAIGKEVVFSCTVTGKGKYKIYAEWYWTQDGKKRSRSTGGKWLEAGPDGKKFTLTFRIPKDNIQTAILAIQLDSEEFITFSDLSLKEAAPSAKSSPKGAVTANFKVAPKARKMILLPKMATGKKYAFTYSVKGSGATGNTTIFHFFNLQVVNRWGNLRSAIPMEDCMDKFQAKTAVFTAPDPEGMDLYLCVVSKSAGTLEFKDLTLKPFDDSGSSERLVLTSPRFRSTFYSSMPEKEVKGHVISGGSVTGGEAVFMTDSGKKLSAALKQSGNRWQFAFPGETGKLEVTLKLKNGKERTLKRTIRRLPPAPVEVIPGPGRRLHINGKPFIHIEIARNGVPQGEQQYHGGTAIRRAVPTTPEACLRILDQAQKDNLKVIVSFMNTVPRVPDEGRLRQWAHRAENVLSKEVLAHPALEGYFLDDEPLWQGTSLKSLRACYEVLLKLDPYRPVWICSAPRGSVEQQREFANCCDISGVDIYPVPVPNSHSHLEDKTLSCVGKYVRRMAEISDETRPVSIILQGFAWGDFSKKKAKIYPTWAESRFMVFDSIINGADLFTWYGLWLIISPEFYDDLMKVIRELHSMTGVIVAENSVPGKVSDPAVEYRTYQGKSWTCTITANTLNKKVKVTFTDVPGVPAKEQTFDPYEVKIFSKGKLPPPLSPLPKAVPEKMPYRNLIIIRRDSIAYNNVPENMKWIWGEKEKSIASSQICARVKFEVGEGLKQASLRFAADDYINGISLDGRKIEPATPLQGSTSYLNVLDFTGALKPGKHVLMLEAGDGGMLPCGLLAELRLEYADGKVVSIPTNAKWETAPKPSGPWQKAAEIKKIGERPWGMPKLLKPVKVK